MAGDYGIDIVNRSNEIKAKKRNKKLAIATLIVILAAVLTVAVMIFLKWFQNDDRVVIEAITKTFSNEGIFSDEGGNIKGLYKVTQENEADNYAVSFDVAETPKQMQGIFDLQVGKNAKMKLTGSYKEGGTLYIKDTELQSFVRRLGGEKVEECIEGGDCEDEEDLTEETEEKQAETDDEDDLLELAKYGQILADVLEGKWYRFAVDEVLSEGDTCVADNFDKVSGDLTRGMISKYYNEAAFLETDKQLDASNDDTVVYEVKIDRDKLTEFLNKLDQVKSTAGLYECLGGKTRTLTSSDLVMRNDWRAELTISKWTHNLEKVKFTGSLEEQQKVEFEMTLSKQAELGIKEPEQAANAEELREDIEEGVRGGMRLMYQELGSKECAKRTGSQQTLDACKEQVMKQGEKTLKDYKYSFPLKIDL